MVYYSFEYNWIYINLAFQQKSVTMLSIKIQKEECPMTQNYFKYFNSTKKSTPIPETVCNQAIKKMFPSLKDERKREKLIQFISSQYKELNCCVLYRISADFNELCRRLGLDPGDQEVIIREDFSIAYSKNFFIPPHNIS